MGSVMSLSAGDQHRSQLIHKKMSQRSNYRPVVVPRTSVTASPGFDNRDQTERLAGCSSLRSRGENRTGLGGPPGPGVSDLWWWTWSWSGSTCRRCGNPSEISGVDMQRGELAGFEVREYLLGEVRSALRTATPKRSPQPGPAWLVPVVVRIGCQNLVSPVSPATRRRAPGRSKEFAPDRACPDPS